MGRYQKYQRKLKYITVLGSTGSIGTQTLEIASEMPEKFKAVALSAGKNIELLTQYPEELNWDSLSETKVILESTIRF